MGMRTNGLLSNEVIKLQEKKKERKSLKGSVETK